MKKISLIYLLVIHILNVANSQTKNEIASLFNTGNGICYTWSTEHASEKIFLLKDTNLYCHIYQERHLQQTCYGRYEITEDSLKLNCFLNCNNIINKNMAYGAFSMPMYDNRFFDTVIVYLAKDTLHTLSASIKKDSITNEDIIVVENDIGNSINIGIDTDTAAQYYTAHIPAHFTHYSPQNSYSNFGIMKNNVLYIDMKSYRKSEFQGSIEPKRRRLGKR